MDDFFKDNLKKYWWILVLNLLIILGLLYVGVLVAKYAWGN